MVSFNFLLCIYKEDCFYNHAYILQLDRPKWHDFLFYSLPLCRWFTYGYKALIIHKKNING